jgi:hypothetical protein
MIVRSYIQGDANALSVEHSLLRLKKRTRLASLFSWHRIFGIRVVTSVAIASSETISRTTTDGAVVVLCRIGSLELYRGARC